MASSSSSSGGGAGDSSLLLSAEQKNAAMNSERNFLTRLFQAAIDGDFDTLKTQVESYQKQQPQQQQETSLSCVDILSQFRDGNKRTALHFACQSMSNLNQPDKRDIVQEILDWLLLQQPIDNNKSNINSNINSIPALLRLKDKEGLTPLMLAARVADPFTAERRVLAILVADAKGQQQQQQSATAAANSWPKLGLARSKVAGATALHYAAGAGATATTIQALMPVSGLAALMAFSKRGGTPLHWAAAAAASASGSTTICALVSAVEKLATATENANEDSTRIALGNFIHASQKAAMPSSSDVNSILIPPAMHMACAAMNQDHAMTLLQTCVNKNICLSPTLTFLLPPFQNSILIMAADLNLVRFLDLLWNHHDVQEALQKEPAPTASSSSQPPFLETNNNNNGPTSSSVSLLDWLRDYQNLQGLTALQVAAREGHLGCVWILMGSHNHSQEDARQYMETFQKDHREQQQQHPSNNATIPKEQDDESSSPPPPPITGGSNGSSSASQEEEKAAKVEAARLLQLPKRCPEKAQLFKLQGNTHFAAQAWQEAIDAYSLAIQEDPANAALYSNRSAAYHHLDIAASSITKTIADTSKNNDDSSNEKGITEKEKETVAKVVVASPTTTTTTVAQQKALSDAWLCRALRSDWPKASFRLATALSAVGRFEDAAVAAWEGLQQDSDNDELKKLLQDNVKMGREQHLQNAKKSDNDKDKDQQ